MNAITYTQARKNFTQTMNQVCDDHAPVIITRQSERPVVMISLEDFNALEETLYLLKSPRNAQRLISAMQRIEKNDFLKKDLLEE